MSNAEFGKLGDRRRTWGEQSDLTIAQRLGRDRVSQRSNRRGGSDDDASDEGRDGGRDRRRRSRPATCLVTQAAAARRTLGARNRGLDEVAQAQQYQRGDQHRDDRRPGRSTGHGEARIRRTPIDFKPPSAGAAGQRGGATPKLLPPHDGIPDGVGRVIICELMRNALRTALVMAILLVWVLAAPLASATGACAAMGGTCEAPCGAGSCALITRATPTILAVVGGLPVPAPDRFHSTSLRLPELPPRSPLLSA